MKWRLGMFNIIMAYVIYLSSINMKESDNGSMSACGALSKMKHQQASYKQRRRGIGI